MEYKSVVNCDAIAFLERLNSAIATLVYFDPPAQTSDGCVSDHLRVLYLHAACHAKRILSNNGVLVWHVLPESDLGVRSCLDRVFGPGFFVSEKVLKRRRNRNVKTLSSTNHTSLIIYSKSANFFYKEPVRSSDECDIFLYSHDEQGEFQIREMTIPGNRPNRRFIWHGFTPPPNRSWRYDVLTMDKMLSEGRIQLVDSKFPREKVYTFEKMTEEIGSVWDDIDLPPAERIRSYSEGQQSLTLLTRIVEMVTNVNDLIVDPFCGSGTSLLAANQLSRQWIGNDSSQAACEQTIRRLKETAGVDCEYLPEDVVLRLPVQCNLTELIRELPKPIESRHVDIHQLVVACESKILEFKQTLSVDIRTNKKEKYIEAECLKTIAGFLNTDGGTLLVGVTNDNHIAGLSEEIKLYHRNSSDRFLLHFKDLIRDQIGEQFYSLIDYDLVPVDGKLILRVDCRTSDSPCFIVDDFYVRTNPATDKLAGPSLLKYIHTRFPDYSV